MNNSRTDLTIPAALAAAPRLDTAQGAAAERTAAAQNLVVYTWRTVAEQNWLERGFGQVDALALVLLPPGLPDHIDLADDPWTGQNEADELRSIAEDGTLPPDPDWTTEFQVTPVDGLTLPDADWVQALEYDGPSVQEMLEAPGSVYHLRTDTGMLLGLTFTFSVTAAGTIAAHGAAHPAVEVRGDYHTFLDETLARAEVAMTPASDRTTRALATYVRSVINDSPEL